MGAKFNSIIPENLSNTMLAKGGYSSVKSRLSQQLSFMAFAPHLSPSDPVVDDGFSPVGGDFPSQSIPVRERTLLAGQDFRSVGNT